MKGIDISYYQGNVDFSKIKNNSNMLSLDLV